MRKVEKIVLGDIQPRARCVLNITLPELLTLWCRHRPRKNEVIREYQLKRWRLTFDDLPAWNLIPEHIEAVVAHMESQGYGASTINKEIAEIRACYSWAIRQQHSPEGFQNPCRYYSSREEPLRYVDLSDDEISALKAAAKLSWWSGMYPLVLMALTSGGRKSEMLGLRWEDIDWHRKRAILHETKAGKRRELYLTDEVLAALKAIQPRGALYHPDQFVFAGKQPYRALDPTKAWRNCREVADLPTLRFHDLRHQCASQLLKAGLPTQTVSQILGHATTTMLERRYGHLASDHLQQAVEAANR